MAVVPFMPSVWCARTAHGAHSPLSQRAVILAARDQPHWFPIYNPSADKSDLLVSVQDFSIPVVFLVLWCLPGSGIRAMLASKGVSVPRSDFGEEFEVRFQSFECTPQRRHRVHGSSLLEGSGPLISFPYLTTSVIF